MRDRAETIARGIARRRNAGKVWDDATRVFQAQLTRERFGALQDDYRTALGAYQRILRVTEARVGIGGTAATFDTVVEFERSSGVRVVFGFERAAKLSPWHLLSFKLVVPMPRADVARDATRGGG